MLLHGYGETGDMWALMAKELARDHTVVAPICAAWGSPRVPADGYDKKTQGHDVAGLLDALKIATVDLVTPRHRQHGGLRLRGAVPPNA